MVGSEESVGRRLILAVDDDERVLTALRRTLSGEGVELLTASSGAEALQLTQRTVPYLILLDVLMPNMDGLTLCRVLKQDVRTADVPIVILSGQTDPVDLDRGLAAGAVDYIKKPFDRDELRFRVRTHLHLREAQEQRNKEHARLLAILSTAKDAIVQMNCQGNVTLWSESATTLFGYSSDEALGQQLHKLIIPERFQAMHLVAVSKPAAAGSSRGDRGSVELFARKKSGAEFPIELSLSSIVIDGEWHAVGICRDISERKHAELLLQQSEARFRASFENASVGQAVATPEGRFIEVNHALATMLGYTEAELRGKAFVEVTHPDDIDESTKARQDLMAGRLSVSRNKKRYVKKDGTAVWADVSVATTRDAQGNVVQFNTHVIDITDRVRVEEERIRSEVKFRTLYEATLDAVMLLDEQGFFDCNEATIRMFGCRSKQEFYSKHPAEVSPECQPCGKPSEELANVHIQTALALGSDRFEWVHRRVDSGMEFPADVLLSRMVLDNRSILQATVRDISERKRAEATLQAEVAQRQRMEIELREVHKLEAVGQLAAGIAHEINTPAQWVSDNVAFLQKGCESMTSVVQAALVVADECQAEGIQLTSVARLLESVKLRKLDRIIREVPRALEQSLEGLRRISSIVVAMKEFSHPSTGRKQATDINAALNTTVTVARNEWKYVADVIFDLDPQLPTVPVLRDELNQVFLNLLVNAAHAISDARGPGEQQKGQITLATRVNGSWLEIRISDTGGGIPPQIQDRIFEPFFTTKPVGRGTGQGLAIARSVVVDKHHGKLFFETEVNHGTTFVIQLPIQDEPVDELAEVS